MRPVREIGRVRRSEGRLNDRYWNEALELRPWAEVERWQAAADCRGRCRGCARARRLRRAARGRRRRAFASSRPTRRAAVHDQGSRPRRAGRGDRRRAARRQPGGAAGRDRADALLERHHRPAALLRADPRDCEVFADAIANTWYTAGVRKGDVVAHLVGLPMVAGGLPYADGFRRVGATLAWLGGFPTDRILREMRHLRVHRAARDDVVRAPSRRAMGRGRARDRCAVTPRQGARRRRARPGAARDARAHLEGLATQPLRDTMGLGDVISVACGASAKRRTACTSMASATS